MRDVGGNYDKLFKISLPRSFLPKQIQVLQACKIYNYILYSGAFRAGKTIMLAWASIIACLENANVEGMLVSQTHTTLKGVVLDTFEKELDLYQNKIYKSGLDLNLTKYINRSEGKMEARLYNNSRVRFRAADKERKLSGYTLDFFGIDEPVDVEENIFRQLQGRISGTGNLKNRFGLLTTNPSSELHWLYKYFYYDDSPPNYIHFDTNTYENRLLPDYNGYIRDMEKSWDADWIRRYLNGKWGMFEGQIYKDLKTETMTGDFSKMPISYHVCGIDWGLEDPHCVLDIGITPDRKAIELKEHYGKRMTTTELSDLILKWHKEIKFQKIYCDPTAADLIQQCYNKGLPIAYMENGKLHPYGTPYTQDVNYGIAKIKSLLRLNLILTDLRCSNLIQQKQAYRYKEGTEKPIKKDDHAVDAERYGLCEFNPDTDTIPFKGTFSNIFKRRK